MSAVDKTKSLTSQKSPVDHNMATVTGSQNKTMRSENENTYNDNINENININENENSHVESVGTKLMLANQYDLDDVNFDEIMPNYEVEHPLRDMMFPVDRDNITAMKAYLQLRFANGHIFQMQKYCNCEEVIVNLFAEFRRMKLKSTVGQPFLRELVATTL